MMQIKKKNSGLFFSRVLAQKNVSDIETSWLVSIMFALLAYSAE